jgi:hypothetical protein
MKLAFLKIVFNGFLSAGGMSFVNQRYCKGGWSENNDSEDSESFFTEQLYIDGEYD